MKREPTSYTNRAAGDMIADAIAVLAFLVIAGHLFTIIFP